MDCPPKRAEGDKIIADCARALYLADREALEAFELEDGTDEFGSLVNEAYEALIAAVEGEAENG